MLKNLKNEIDNLNADKRAVVALLSSNITKLEYLKKEVDKHIKLRYIIILIVDEIQQEFKNSVESMVTLAVQSVFDESYTFKLIFEEKNNQLECRPVIMNNDFEYTPDDDMGGSVVNIISFALRCVLWAYEEPKSRPIFIMDEPFTWVGEQLIEKAGQLIHNISHELGLQMIISTHIDEIREFGDAVYSVQKINNISHVTKEN